MSEVDLFSGAKEIISIKANYEIRDETGFNVLEKTKGELVLTEKEFVFLEVKGTFKKEKKRVHGFPSDRLIGQSFTRWTGGPTLMYLTYEDESGNSKYYIYSVSKGDYDKFIGKVHELRLI
ncbi:MAG: hypothetical protein ACXADB_05405 [Candidatus Hermodarchaeia archaeon]|jgi:hypothetical protein